VGNFELGRTQSIGRQSNIKSTVEFDLDLSYMYSPGDNDVVTKRCQPIMAGVQCS